MSTSIITQSSHYSIIDKRQGIVGDNYKIDILKQYDNTIDFSVSGGLSETEKLVPNVINLSGTQRLKSFGIVIQSWIGYVKDVKEETFTAILNDTDNPTTNEIAEFEIKNDISSDDIHLLKKGAIFYWSIGYNNHNGQRKKESFIRFKRVVEEFTEEDVNVISDKAEKLSNNILWE